MASYTIKSLFHHSLRLTISILGIGIAIALIIIINGFAEGFYKQTTSYFRNNSANIIVADSDEGIIANYTYLPSKIKTEIKDSKSVTKVSEIVFTPYFFNETSITLLGFDDKTNGPWMLSQGRNIEEDNEIVLDSALADENNISLNNEAKIYNKKFKVVGLSSGTSSFISPLNFMSLKAIRSLTGTKNMTSSFMVKASNVKTALKSISDNLSEGTTFTMNAIIKSEEEDIKQVMASPIKMISLIALIIGLLVITLTSYVATLSKMKEFGILKAMGAKDNLLYSIVIKQSLISTILGFLVGVGIAFLSAYLISAIWPKLLIYITLDQVIQTAILAIMLALAASYVPVRKVNKVDPAIVFKG